MSLNWAQEFVLQLQKMVVASGLDPDHMYKAANAPRGTLERKRNGYIHPAFSRGRGTVNARRIRSLG